MSLLVSLKARSLTLLSIFVNDNIDVLDNLINCIMYADDSSLYCFGNDISEVRSNLQLGLNVASEWFHNNRLLINNRLL